jgi:hypothetical protein
MTQVCRADWTISLLADGVIFSTCGLLAQIEQATKVMQAAQGDGSAAGTAQTGTPITATDWTSDNWREILLACPANGGIYQFDRA